MWKERLDNIVDVMDDILNSREPFHKLRQQNKQWDDSFRLRDEQFSDEVKNSGNVVMHKFMFSNIQRKEKWWIFFQTTKVRKVLHDLIGNIMEVLPKKKTVDLTSMLQSAIIDL